jgi:hypothetical protein
MARTTKKRDKKWRFKNRHSIGDLICVNPAYSSYGWIPHNAGFGFLDIAGAALGQIHF